MHMHTVAPNRLQEDLCNLWRLHISHCQHTQTHRPQASTQPLLPIAMMPRDEQSTTHMRNHYRQTKLACQSSREFLINCCPPTRHLRSAHMVMRSVKPLGAKLHVCKHSRQQEAMRPFSSGRTGHTRPYSVETGTRAVAFAPGTDERAPWQ
jgi:hypothetical protein